MSIELWLGILELVAIFATAMGGAFTAVRSARLDAVGVLTVGTMTALGGGVMRDLVIGAVPPAMFTNMSYLLVAAAGSLAPLFLAQPGTVLRRTIKVIDAVGLGLFAVIGTEKALLSGLQWFPAVVVGVVAAVGGGIVRDTLVNRVPDILRADFYVTPAAAGALVVVIVHALGLGATVVPSVAGAAVCFVLRVLGIVYGWGLPRAKHIADGE